MTDISWVRNPDGAQGETINPIIGCSKCSPGCANCYAERMAARLSTMDGPVGNRYRQVITDGHWNGKAVFCPEVIDEVLRRKKPTTYFVGSMTDLFHESVQIGWMTHILDTIRDSPQHKFIFLTKRPERIIPMFYGNHATRPGYTWRYSQPGTIIPNLGLGVTVCNQSEADVKIPLLLQTPAAMRFVSIEPMLDYITVDRIGAKCQWEHMSRSAVKREFPDWFGMKGRSQ